MQIWRELHKIKGTVSFNGTALSVFMEIEENLSPGSQPPRGNFWCEINQKLKR